jgi:hypothetical protein
MSEMRDVDHTHPHTDEPFGGRFRRGVVAADGGQRGSETAESEQMDEVSHESPDEGANRAFERGREGRDERV